MLLQWREGSLTFALCQLCVSSVGDSRLLTKYRLLLPLVSRYQPLALYLSFCTVPLPVMINLSFFCRFWWPLIIGECSAQECDSFVWAECPTWLDIFGNFSRSFCVTWFLVTIEIKWSNPIMQAMSYKAISFYGHLMFIIKFQVNFPCQIALNLQDIDAFPRSNSLLLSLLQTIAK
jgi:hypothetical protein